MLTDPSPDTVAAELLPLSPDAFRRWSADAPPERRRWAEALGFAGKAGQLAAIAGPSGAPAAVLVGTGADPDPFVFGALPHALPAGDYALPADVPADLAERLTLGWALGAWRYDGFKAVEAPRARLAWPATVDRPRIERAAAATALVRTLVTTPANAMGPAELAAAARALAATFGADCTVIEGDTLAGGYPLIHAVGRASARPPCLIDLRWGDPDAPRVTLVGKGVCFDTGGLDLKPSSAMLLMKKDMGGAAHALGAAHMVMAAGLRVRLRVLIPAVENAVSGAAFRPLDVYRSRKGLTVEIGNTDAEGRLVLADALADACDERPALLVDFATLTGAARVALGPDLPAMFCNDDEIAAALADAGARVADPVWRLPLWRPYGRLLESSVADLSSTSDGPFAGAITAALFLEHFVEPGVPWVHLDLYAWNGSNRPGRPKGGEAMAMRAVAALIEDRFGR